MKKLGAYTTIKILFLVIALAVSPLIYITVANYSNVMDAKINLPYNIWIEDVLIPEITNESADARVTLVLNVNNPTAIDIYVYDVDFNLYIDNVSDPMDFDNPDEWIKYAVGSGGFTYTAEEDYIKVPTQGSRRIYANMTVLGDTRAMDNLNVTDTQGKYHPLIIASFRYTFEHLDIKEVIHGIYYYSAQGISPGTLEV